MSPEAQAQVRRLYAPPPRWSFISDPRLDALARLRELAEPDTLRHLLKPLAAGGAVGTAAAAAVDALFSNADAAGLARFDADIREGDVFAGYAPGRLGDWWGLTPDRLARRAPTGWLRLAFFGAAASHRSGYVREAAVRALADERTGRELPFLVLRLDDWVPEVRAAAEPAVRARLTGAYAAAWAAALPLVARLEDRERHRMADLGDDVAGLLADAPDVFRAALTSRARSVRRAAHALAAGGALAEEAARLAVRDDDLLIRLGAARAVAGGRVGAPDVEAALLRDPAHTVRRTVLLGKVERDAPGTDDALRTAVLDVHSAVRHVARYFLTKRSVDAPDFGDSYRRALAEAQDPPHLRGALGGLAETGSAADAALVRPFVEHRPASVRAAALRALLALDRGSAADAVRAALADPSPRVVRAAIGALAEGVPGVDGEAELARLAADDRVGVAREAVRALAALPHWQALPHLVRAAGHPLEPVAERAVGALERWVEKRGRVFVAPSDRQREASVEALASASLPDGLDASVRSALDRAGR